MNIGVWPRDGWWSVASNWRGHPRYLFIGRWFAYRRSATIEWGDWGKTVDYRTWRIRRKEFEFVRPLKSVWAKYWAYRIAYGIQKELG